MKIIIKTIFLIVDFCLLSLISVFAMDQPEQKEASSVTTFVCHPSYSSSIEDYPFIFPENQEHLGSCLLNYFSSLQKHESVHKELEIFINLATKLYITQKKQCPLTMKHNIENFYAYLSQEDDAETCIESIKRLIIQHQSL